MMEQQRKGKVWLVGAGPSDVGLLTLKAKEVLESADVVVYDSLVGKGILALMPGHAKLINAGKRAGNYMMAQEETNEVLMKEALAGQNVVRLKGGDPFLFGRGGEELELLKEHGIPFEIIPGVTSAISVPAYAGIPVTHRDFCSSVHIITGHRKHSDKPEIDFSSLVKLDGTLVFLMGVGSLSYICSELIRAGMSEDMPAAILEKGTTSKQRRVVSTVKNLPEDSKKADIQTPAIIIVGKVCTLANDFHWAEDRLLGGVRVLVTRPVELASQLSARLREYGAEVIEVPSIETRVIENNRDLINAIDQIHRYQWIVFTSPTGVKIFFKQMIKQEKDIRDLANIKFAAIGLATKRAINERGLGVDLLPDEHYSQNLGIALANIVLPNEKVLIPRARIGSKELTEELNRNDINYEDISTYDTNHVQSELMRIQGIRDELHSDYVAFTSASTVTGFVKSFGNDFDYSSYTAVCIGKQTAKQAEKFGMKTVISDSVSIQGMVDKIIELEQSKKQQV